MMERDNATEVERAAFWVCAWEKGAVHYEVMRRKGQRFGVWDLPKRVVTARGWDCLDGMGDAIVRLRAALGRVSGSDPSTVTCAMRMCATPGCGLTYGPDSPGIPPVCPYCQEEADLLLRMVGGRP
jgi:hypothetical protein